MSFTNQLKRIVGKDDFYPEYEVESDEVVRPTRPHRSNTGGKKSMGVVLFRELFEFKHVVEVCEALEEGSVVICNLQRCDDASIQRIIDFLSGAACILKSDIRRTGNRIYICAPSSYILNGKYLDNLEDAKTEAGKFTTEQESSNA